MSPSEMLASDAVAVTFGNRILGKYLICNNIIFQYNKKTYLALITVYRFLIF